MGAASPYTAGVELAVLETGAGPVRVACAMSVPRLSWMDHQFCWVQGRIPYGIAPMRYEGAFWGQCLTRVLQTLIEEDNDPSKPPLVILTLDYDSIFTRDAVPKMLTYLMASDYDVVAAVQSKRRSGEPLFTMLNEDGTRATDVRRDQFILNNIVPVYTAHFGFTMIRASALKKMPHPWFLGHPGADGKWGDDRTDDDIHFCNVARDAGVKCGVCTRVAIGHAEVHFKWPDQSMQATLQHPTDYWEAGGAPPANAWR